MKQIKLLTLLAALVCITPLRAVTIDNGKLPGKFSVSATKVVSFSQGNLQYVGTWQFAENQYDFFGTSQSDDHRDLFGWGTGDAPNKVSESNGDYSSFTDWGTNAITNGGNTANAWRTLTKDEWLYMLETRTTSGIVNSTSNARYTAAKILTDGSGTDGLTFNICGIILFPDKFNGTASYSGVTWGTINAASEWTTTCTTAGWAALENAGCAFLPAAGSRYMTSILYAGEGGGYWSSSAYDADYAYYMLFRSDMVNPQSNGALRCIGYSVRLVKELPAATVTSAPTASGSSYNYNPSYNWSLFYSGSSAGGTMMYQVTTTNTKPGKDEGTWSTWSSSISSHKNAGTYYLWYYVAGDANHSDSEVFGPVEKEIQKRNAQVATAPSSKSGVYWTGSAQALFNAGTASFDGTTMMYKVTTTSTKPSKSDEGWASSIPEFTEIGSYWLWYYVAGDANHNDSEVSTANIQSSISKAYPSVTKPTALNIIYDGNEHELVTAGTTNLGELEYSLDGTNWSTDLPTASAKGSYTIYYRVVFSDSEHYNNYGPYHDKTSVIADAVAQVTTSGDVTTKYLTFDAAVSAWVDGSTLKLLQAIETTSSSNLNNKNNLTLDLNGFGIKFTGSGNPIFKLQGNTALTITDSNSSATHKFRVNSNDNYATLDEVNGDIIVSGGYLTGGRKGAIQISSENASLTLQTGTLIGNYNTSDAGGGVKVDNGTFTMNGGSIQYNYSNNQGAGVYLASSTTFNLNGGSITYNVMNGSQGGGVSTASGVTFNMDNAPEVRYNQRTNGETDNVYIYGSYYSGGDDNYIRIHIGANLDKTKSAMVGVSSYNVSDAYNFPEFTYGLGNYFSYFFADHPYNQVEDAYYTASGEARLTWQKHQLQLTAPTASTTIAYDGQSHVTLSTPATADGPADIQYSYKFKRHGGSFGSQSDWSTSIPYGTEAGVYRVYYKAVATDTYNYNNSGTNSYVEFTISRADIEYIAEPVAVDGLVYTGTPLELVTIASDNALRIVGSAQSIAGSSTMIHYDVACAASNPGCEGQGWVEGQLPNALNPGCYDVTYWVPISDNYNQIGEKHLYNICIEGPSVSETDYDIADYFGDRIGDVMPLKIYRTLLKNGYFNTLCLPFDLSAAQIAASALAGSELFVFAEAEIEENEETGEPQLRQVITPATTITAGEPYLIRWKTPGETITELNFSSVTIQNAMGAGVDPSALDAADGVQFVGFVPRTHIDYSAGHDYLFLGQNNTLVWPETDDSGSMKGFRAYFYIPSGTTIGGAPVFRGMSAKLVIREDTPTGVESVSQSAVSAQKIIRDGQLIIIRNGVEYNANGSIIK